MRALSVLIRGICRFNWMLGQLFSWLSLGLVVVCFTVVVLRYAFAIGQVWMQDLFVWMSGVMFMGIAGYTLMVGQHVRVDVFYRPASIRRKAWVDLIGSIVFVGPFVSVLVIYALPFVERSWRYLEGSSNFGGMPGLYIIKSFILVFAFVIALQSVAMALRSILILAGREDLVPSYYQYRDTGAA